MDTKGVILWIGFAVVCAGIVFFSRRMKKQIEENGVETTGVISRIEDVGAADEIDLRYYARYRTEDGQEIEGVLLNPRSGLDVGQQVRLKYHPKFKINARLVG